jgi:hypothetical protein
MKIAICIPGSKAEMVSTINLAGLSYYTGRHTEDELLFCTQGGCYVSYNRTDIAKRALDSGADALAWIDPDQIFPIDGIHHLLKRNVPIVGASYRIRRPPSYPLALPILETPTGPLVRAAYLLGGFNVVRREVYEKIPAPWYRADYDLDPARPGEFIGEDVYFFKNLCIPAGFDVWLDLDMSELIGHALVTEHHYRDIPRPDATRGLRLWQILALNGEKAE